MRIFTHHLPSPGLPILGLHLSEIIGELKGYLKYNIIYKYNKGKHMTFSRCFPPIPKLRINGIYTCIF